MKKNIIDLTAENLQGEFGYDVVDALNKPGYYRIRMAIGIDDEEAEDLDEDDEWWRPVDVNIDAIAIVRKGTMQLIHTSDEGIFRDGWAYYNGNQQAFKDCIECCEIEDELIDEFGSIDCYEKYL